MRKRRSFDPAHSDWLYLCRDRGKRGPGRERERVDRERERRRGREIERAGMKENLFRVQNWRLSICRSHADLSLKDLRGLCRLAMYQTFSDLCRSLAAMVQRVRRGKELRLAKKAGSTSRDPLTAFACSSNLAWVVSSCTTTTLLDQVLHRPFSLPMLLCSHGGRLLCFG